MTVFEKGLVRYSSHSNCCQLVANIYIFEHQRKIILDVVVLIYICFNITYSLFAVLSLGISTLFELLCIVLYAIYFPKLSIVKYYRSKAALEGAQTVSADLAVVGIQSETNQQVINVTDHVKRTNQLYRSAKNLS